MIDPQSALVELVREHVDGFVLLDVSRTGALPDVHCSYANPAAGRMLGSHPDAPSVHDLAPLIEDLPGVATRVLSTGVPWTTEAAPLRDRFVRLQLTRIRERVGLWLSDVTSHTRAPERSTDDRTEAELRDLRALFSTVFDSSPLGIAVLDRSHRHVAVNAAAVELLGRSEGELIGGTPRELWPELAPVIESVLDEVLATGEPRLGNEIELLTSNGPRFLLFGSYPVKHDDEVLGTGTFIMDITHRRQVEESQQQLIGIVSHDLRSPLQAVLIGSQMLLRQGKLDPGQTNSVSRIVRCARHMSRLIDDLSDFTRIRVGHPLEVRRRPANIDEICRQVLMETESAFPDRTLDYHGAGEPHGYWDAGRLVQVLTNLVTNAVKYSAPEQAVELAWWREPPADRSDLHEDLVIEVRNGGAMPTDVAARLFEPFRRGQVNDGHGRSSLGLGLYIVKHLVQAHGGTVSVASSEETGTVFRVRLPSDPPHDTPSPRWREPVGELGQIASDERQAAH